MDIPALIIVATGILVFGLFSRRLESTILTPPILFTLFGLAVSEYGLGLIDGPAGSEALFLLAEITLVLVLFSDASRIDIKALRKELGLPVRLLAIGMPLTIIFGGFLALVMFSEISLWEALLIGAILAPTDAALGQAVVSSPIVPQRIRQALNVESGLNDGIALPLVMIFAALASMSMGGQRTTGEWTQFVLMQVTLGPLVGIVVAYAGARFILFATGRGWINSSMQRISGLAIACLCYAVAHEVGGNSFIAAFVGGMTLGNTLGHTCESMHEFIEAEGQMLMLGVFLLVGMGVTWPVLSEANVTIILYSALSLTVIRIIPVAIAMAGTGLRMPSVGFLGWFGPRGLASILFVLVVLGDVQLGHPSVVFNVVITTVLLSILLHGLTAVPGAQWYGRMVEGNAENCENELIPVTEHRLRQTLTLPAHTEKTGESASDS